MKKLFTAAFLSVALLPLSSGTASAWCWPWKCCGQCYDFSICCKQYNAFTPICFGKLYCDGCCPSPYLNGYGHSPAHGNCLPLLGSACGDTQFLGQLPPPDAIAPPTFHAPMPSPVDGQEPATSGASSNQMPSGTPMIQPTGYQVIYPAGYAIPGYYPTTGMPNYWYGNGGY